MPGRPAAQPVSAEAEALTRLRRALPGWCLPGAIAFVAAAVILADALGLIWLRWGLATLISLGLVYAFIALRLPLHRRPEGGPLLDVPGVGNRLTITRGLLIAHLPGYLLLPEPPGPAAWLPALTYTGAMALDYFDGYFARREGTGTRLGEALDVEFDGLAILSGAALAVHYGRLPWLYLATVGVARYVYLVVGWTAVRLGLRLHDLPPSDARRGLAVASMTLGIAALWPIAPAPMMTAAAAIVGVPILAGFVRDALIRIGRLDPSSPRYLRARRTAVGFATGVLPLVLRLALPILLIPILLSAGVSYGEAAPDWLDRVGLVVTWIGLGLMTTGFAGRSGAVLVIVAYGISQAMTGLTPPGVSGWSMALAIYLFGTGPGSLWAPERRLIVQRAGEEE